MSRASFLSLFFSFSLSRYIRSLFTTFQCCTRERDSIHVLRAFDYSILSFFSFLFLLLSYVYRLTLRHTCDEIVKRSLRLTRSVRHDVCVRGNLKKGEIFILRAKKKEKKKLTSRGKHVAFKDRMKSLRFSDCNCLYYFSFLLLENCGEINIKCKYRI